MTRVQIFKRVCPPGFDKPLDLGDVVEIDDGIAERYIKAEYALATDEPVTALYVTLAAGADDTLVIRAIVDPTP